MSEIDNARRRFLITTTSVVGAVGAAAAGYVFVRYMSPSDKTKVQGGPILVDFSKLQPGQLIITEWRSKPVWILRRTKAMLERLKTQAVRDLLRDPDSKVETQQPDYAANQFRSINSEIFIVIALCTHLGCIPKYISEPGASQLGSSWPGGFFCPCHGSKFDLAGRVFKGVPAPTNLVVPPHYYVDKTIVKIGVDKG